MIPNFVVLFFPLQMAELTELLRMPSPIRDVESNEEKWRKIALQTMRAKQALKEMQQKRVEMGVVQHASSQTEDTTSVGDENKYSNYIAHLERKCKRKNKQRRKRKIGHDAHGKQTAGYRRVFEANGVLRVNVPTERVDLS